MPPVLALILRRLAAGVAVLLLVHLATFFALRLMPGDPWADVAGDRALPEAAVERLKELYGQGGNRSVVSQYLGDLGAKLTGDFGLSLKIARGHSVLGLITAAAPISMAIGAGALALGMLLGIWAGTVAARTAGRWPDRTLRAGATLGISTPDFILAPLMLTAFSLWLGWLPAGGIERPSALLLPVLTLGLPLAAQLARLVRTSLSDELAADFVRTARAKGADEGRIVYEHALRPAFGPVLAYLATAAAAVLTGSMVVETVFAVPGLGYFFVAGALQQDWTVVSSAALFYAALLVGFNLLADLGLAWLDPRTRS